jgi:hypothetical protein
MDGPDEFISKLEKQYSAELQALKDKYTNLLKQYLVSCNDNNEDPLLLTSEEEEEPRYMTRHQKRMKEDKENPRYTPMDVDVDFLVEEGSIESMSDYEIGANYHDNEEEGDDCGPPEVFVGDAKNLSLLLDCTRQNPYSDCCVRDKWYMRTFGNILTAIKSNLGNEVGSDRKKARNAIAQECWDNIVSSCTRGLVVTRQSECANHTTCGFCGETRQCVFVFTVLKVNYHMGKYCYALANAVMDYYTALFKLRGRKIKEDDVFGLRILLDKISERQEEKAASFKKNEH